MGIALDVVVHSLQRRDVKEVNGVRQRLLRPTRDQFVQLPQKCRECFSRPRWSKYERVPTACNRRLSLTLRIARLGERLLEPLPHHWMKWPHRSRASSQINLS